MSSLKKRTSLALAWDVGGTIIRQGSGFIVSIFLARLLSPEDFGLVGIAMVYVTLAEAFIDVGFSNALIQSRDVNDLTFSSVFFINIIAGLLLTALFYFTAPTVASFYGNVEIENIVRWLSLIFVFNSANLVQMAILKRELNFKVVTVRTAFSAIIGGIAGVIAALYGLGVYSLVIQQISMAIMGSILLWSISGWKPKLEFSLGEVKKLLGFSSYMFFDRMSSTFLKRLDVIVIGKIFSPAILGFYTRAFSLKNLVIQYTSNSVNKVFFSVLSELQNDEPRFREVYMKLISLVAFLSYALTGILFVLGRDIILILFGQKWEYSIFIFQLLVLAFVTQPIEAQIVNAFLSKGKAKENFYIGLMRKTARVSPLVVAYYYGMTSYLYVSLVVNYLLAFLSISLMSKYVSIGFYNHFMKLTECIFPLVLCVCLYFYFDFDSKQSISRILLASGFMIVYLVYNYAIKNAGLKYLLMNVEKLYKGKII